MAIFEQNNRRTGMHYEDVACSFLENYGLRIISRNFRIRIGEIDIIAQDKDCTCFIEVKFRHSLKFGRPAESVTYRKQQTIRKVAEYWLMKTKQINKSIRFDVIEMVGSEINYIKYAF